MKHNSTIRKFVASLHESWMNDADKAAFDAEVIGKFGAQLDQAIDQGISNGYSEKQQLDLITKIFG